MYQQAESNPLVVSFVGIVSNVAQLCVKYRWLHWLYELPDPVVSIISGILPPVALAILRMLLPIVLHLLAWFEGIPRFTGLELSLMTRYFIFQVVVRTLSSCACLVTTNSYPRLALVFDCHDLVGYRRHPSPTRINPTSTPTILTQKLPEASTFLLRMPSCKVWRVAQVHCCRSCRSYCTMSSRTFPEGEFTTKRRSG
jgi:hypothetical protein